MKPRIARVGSLMQSSKKAISILLAFTLATTMASLDMIPASAKPSEETIAEAWITSYDGPPSGGDYARAMCVDPSGNVYVTGSSEGIVDGMAAMDYATVKYDSDGNETWVARYNGPGNGWDDPHAIAVDKLGNVYVTGWSPGIGTSRDYATVKYDSDGNETWVARYNGPDNGIDEANAIAVDGLGNVHVTGRSDNIFGTAADYATVKYDSDGNETWVACYDGPVGRGDSATAMTIDASGNVYVTGCSWGGDTSWDYATVKYDSDGNETWVARYDEPGSDTAEAIAVDGSGNVYVTGLSGSDYTTVKYGPDGNEVWVACYDNGDDQARAIAVDGSGSVYVTGWSSGSGTGFDYATVKYDSDGNETWVARYDGPAGAGDYAHAIAIDVWGNVYITGDSRANGTGYDYTTVKYDSDGNELWVARSDADFAVAIGMDSLGNIYVTGSSGADYVTIKYIQWGYIDDYIQNLPDDAVNKNPDQRKNAMHRKLMAVLALVSTGEYPQAIDKLLNDIQPKMDGNPRPPDWVISPEAQQELCAIIDNLIAYLETLL